MPCAQLRSGESSSTAWSSVSQPSPQRQTHQFEIPVQMYHDSVLKAELEKNPGVTEDCTGIH